MPLDNKFIGYVDRTYEQIKSNILLKFGNNVPEITDHSDSNPWVKAINIFAGIAEMLNYYLDVNARESFLLTAKQFRSAIKIAKFFDYRTSGALASSVDVKFYVDNATTQDIIIPEGTQVSTKEGVKFLTVSDVQIDIGSTEISVSAKQHTQVLSKTLGTSNGSSSQSYILDDDVENESATIRVDTDIYAQIDTFAEATSDSEIYISELNSDKQMIVEFGDDINGKIPPTSLVITADYYVTEGADGNVSSESITIIDSTITVPSGFTLKVNNIEGSSGGVDVDSLTTLKKKIPLFNRTKNRAVTEQDFIDITELSPGVEKGGLVYNCGKLVEIFIVPSGGGIASTQLISDTYDFVFEKKIITTNIEIKSAGQIIIQFGINIFALPNSQNDELEQLVKDNISEFLSSDNQTIKGKVQINDIIAVVENTTGVDYSEFTVMKPIPYARPLNNTDLLDWDREIQDSSSTTKQWLIRFVSTTQFELSQDGSFLGTFNVDTQNMFSDIVFTINGNYTAGNQYEFYTYKAFGSLVLSEPSVPAADQTEMSINVTGGI